MTDRDRIATALLALRLGIFVVMFMWTLDKFVNVPHASRVFENFYGLEGLGRGAMVALGAAELMLVLAFCFALYLLRDLDTKWTVDGGRLRKAHGAVTPPIA